MTVHISIKGGLGNQLFQYSFGVYLKEKYNASIYYDILPLEFIESNLTKREYTLSQIDANLKLTSRKIHSLFYSQNSNTLIKILKKICRKLFNFHFISEESFNETSLLDNYTYYLDGYWQDTKFAKLIVNAINENSNLQMEKDIELEKIKKSGVSVAIHIRRGDYVTNTVINNYHGSCDINYFTKAMRLIEEKINVDTYFVFSDDIEWAKNNLTSNKPLNFMDKNDALTDLLLMKNCCHQIISNSTFSFWAAFLNTYSKKHIIAPKKWTNHIKTKDSNLYNETWILI